MSLLLQRALHLQYNAKFLEHMGLLPLVVTTDAHNSEGLIISLCDDCFVAPFTSTPAIANHRYAHALLCGVKAMSNLCPLPVFQQHLRCFSQGVWLLFC